MVKPTVYNVTDWWAKYDDLLKKITDLVACNGPAWEIKSSWFPEDYQEINKGCEELGFRDIVQFCESFPSKFVVDHDTGNIQMNQVDRTETKSTLQPNLCAPSTQKTNMDDETKALLVNYNPVPPSQRREEDVTNTNTSSSITSEKKSECIHFKFSHDEKTRRFALPRESDLIGSVKERVQKIVEKKEPTLYWRDEDSLIVLECGDDMEAAIDYAEHQKTPACVMLEATVDDKETAQEVKEEKEAEEEVKPTIVSREESAAAFNGFAFVCDECDCFLGPKTGGRFKCIVCDNYDLCAACVVKGTHANHALVRLLDAETIVPLADNGKGEIYTVPLMRLPRCTPSFSAKLAGDLAQKKNEMDALKSITEMLKSVVDERLVEIEREEGKLAEEREKLEQVKMVRGHAEKKEDKITVFIDVEAMREEQEMIEESRKIVEEELLRKEEERLEEERLKIEEERLEEERLKIEEEEKEMIEERRQIIEEIAMYEVLQREREKEEEEMLRLEEERCRIEEEEKRKEEQKKTELMEEIAEYEEKLREKERKLEEKMLEAEEKVIEDMKIMKETMERATEREEMKRQLKEKKNGTIMFIEDDEDSKLTPWLRMQKEEWIRRKREEYRKEKEMDDLMRMERKRQKEEAEKEKEEKEEKEESIDAMMKNIQGDLEKIGEAVEEMTQIEVALSKELGEKKEEEGNDLWIAYESWKEEVKLEQKERKDSSSLGSDIEIIDKLVEESDSVLETMHVLETKFGQLQLPIRETAVPALPTVPTAPLQPTVPATASSTTVYTTAPSTPTVDSAFDVFSFMGVDRASLEPSAPEEPTKGMEEYVKFRMSQAEEQQPIRRNFELGSAKVDHIPVFMEHKVMMELYEMKDVREVPTRINQYFLNLALNADSLKEHKRILNQNKEVDDELIRIIASEMQLRLKEMRSVVGISPFTDRHSERLLSRVCQLRAQIRGFSFEEDLTYRTICKDLHRVLLTDEFTVQPINSSEAPSWPIPSTTSAFTPYYDAHSMSMHVPVAQPIPRSQRNIVGEPLDDQQQALLRELYATGIFNDDEDYERMVEVSRHANNLEQAIDMMLE